MFDEAIYYTFRIKSPKAGIIFLFIEKYVNAGIKQYKRIKQCKDEISRSKTPREFKEPLQNIFFEIHFYLVCWDKVYCLFLKFCEIVGDARLKAIKDKYIKDFEKYSEVRNHLEHIDERLVGKTRGKKAKFPGDLGNLSGDYYTFWGYRYYVGEKSVEKLKEFYLDLLRLIKTDLVDENNLAKISTSVLDKGK